MADTSSLQVRRQLNVVAQQRISRNDRIAEQQAKVVSVRGEIVLDQPGEATVDVSFPVLFIEKPFARFALEMGPNQSVLLGSYPVYGVTVNRWVYKQVAENIRYWVGANIAIRVQAPKGSFVVNWEFEATALRSPGSGVESVDSVL